MFSFVFNKLTSYILFRLLLFCKFFNIIYFQQMYTHSKHTNVHMSSLSESVSQSLTLLAPEDNCSRH